MLFQPTELHISYFKTYFKNIAINFDWRLLKTKKYKVSFLFFDLKQIILLLWFFNLFYSGMHSVTRTPSITASSESSVGMDGELEIDVKDELRSLMMRYSLVELVAANCPFSKVSRKMLAIIVTLQLLIAISLSTMWFFIHLM